MEKDSDNHINIFSEAIRVGHYFAEFFINLARQSSHKFESRLEQDLTFLAHQINDGPSYTN